MLQRAARVLLHPIKRIPVGERPMQGTLSHYSRYGWRSIDKAAGEKCLPRDHISACTTTNDRRSWLKTKKHQYHHQPFTIGSNITNMSSTTLLTTTTVTTEASTLPLWAFPNTTLKECHVRLYSTKPPSIPQSSLDENHNESRGSGEKDRRDVETGTAANDDKKEDKLTLVQKFKLMYKQYWYVLIPVHVFTSVIWYGSFFIAAKSGVDIVPIMQKLGAGEKILSHLQNSDAGYYAIAYAMYKIATPARYTVTIGGTTLSINYLKKRGYIKPVPSSEKLKEMYEGKREEFIEKKGEMVDRYQEKKGEIVDRYKEQKDRYQEKKGEIVDRYQEKKEEMVERYQEKRDKYQERKGEIVDRYQEKKEEMKEKLKGKKER